MKQKRSKSRVHPSVIILAGLALVLAAITGIVALVRHISVAQSLRLIGHGLWKLLRILFVYDPKLYVIAAIVITLLLVVDLIRKKRK